MRWSFTSVLRGHWSIENGLHWSLDVVCGKDACRVSKGYASENLNIVRKVALSLLRVVKNPHYQRKKKMSGHKKMFAAAFAK